MATNSQHAASMEKFRFMNLTMANGNHQQSLKVTKVRSSRFLGQLMGIYLPPAEEINQSGFGNAGKKELVQNI